MSNDLPSFADPAMNPADTEHLVQAAECTPALPPALRRRCVQAALSAQQADRQRKWAFVGMLAVVLSLGWLGNRLETAASQARDISREMTRPPGPRGNLQQEGFVRSEDVDWQLVEEKQRQKRQTLALIRSAF